MLCPKLNCPYFRLFVFGVGEECDNNNNQKMYIAHCQLLIYT